MNFQDYCIGIIIRPVKTFSALSKDKKNLKYGVTILIAFFVLNSILNIGFIIGKKLPTMPMLLKIPDKYYYLWCLLVANFAIIFCYKMTSAIIYFLIKFFKGKGTIEATFSAVAFAYSIPFFFYLAMDYVVLFAISLNGMVKPEGIFNLLLTGSSVVALICHFILLPMVVKAVHEVKWGPAILVGAFSNCIFWGFAAIFLL